jgi:hypothetical protein
VGLPREAGPTGVEDQGTANVSESNLGGQFTLSDGVGFTHKLLIFT